MNINGLIETMLVLFGVILIGYIINKAGILNHTINMGLSELVVKVTCPALVISSVCVDLPTESTNTVWLILFLGVCLYLFYVLIAKVIVIPFRLSKADSAIYQMMLTFSNNVFIGYPLAKVLYGDAAIFYMSLLHMPFNLLIYTYGVYLTNQGSGKQVKLTAKDLISPGLISSVLALVIYLGRIPVPNPLVDILAFVAAPTTMLSMLIIGSSLAMISLEGILREYKLFFLSIIRLILMPLLVYSAAGFIVSDPVILGLLTLSAGLPAASMIVMLASQYDGNTRVSSLGIFITTLFSIVTIPLMFFILL